VSGLFLFYVFPQHGCHKIIVVEIFFYHRFNGFFEFFRLGVLQQKGMHTHFHHMKNVFFAVVHGEDNDLDIGIFLQNILARFNAIHNRHLQIHNSHVGLLIFH
jgi:hypothetical protein